MPTFKLPPVKQKDDKDDMPQVVGMSDSLDYQRRVSLPGNKAILDSLSVDDQVEVKLIGKVIGTRSVEGQYKERSFELEITEVSAYETRGSDADFESGYNEE